MRTDLDLVNAALALGDKFIPPFGSICEVKTMGSVHAFWEPEKAIEFPTWFVSVDHVMRETPGKVCFEGHKMSCETGAWRECGIDGQPYLGCRRIWSIKDMKRVVFVPEESPPFSEWERV